MFFAARKNAARDEGAKEVLIGQRLIAAGVVTEQQLAEALATQAATGKRLVATLVDLDHLEAADFVDFLAKMPGMPTISLENYRVDRELLEMVPRYFAEKFEIFPLDRMGKLLTLGMVCPLDKRAIAVVERMTGLKVKPMLCPASQIHAAIERYYKRINLAFDNEALAELEALRPKSTANETAVHWID